MKNCETDYKEPHHVMLVFKSNVEVAAEKESALSERCNYYQKLKEQGKAVLSGDFWNQEKNFMILFVTSASELEEIIDQDPGLKHSIVELVRAMPFTCEEALQYGVAV
jgi:uncharacterized protein YciI